VVATSVASVITASAARAVADCGRRDHLNDYLDVVTLLNELLVTPPIELWPNIVQRVMVPPDVEAILLTELESVG
jgi:hypothetical protein